MKQIALKKAGIQVPEIALGCMRINNLEKKEIKELVEYAMEEDINFFDHADIYGRGVCETLFSEAIEMNETLREKMIIQTKCAIRPGIGYDASKEHILYSVEESLKRLKTDYIDILLLHRPDALIEPEEVAEAFHELNKQGKVKYFGVSNCNPYQIALLNKYCEEPMVINQLQLSITECGMVDAGMNVNMQNTAGIDRDGSILDYCRLNDITIQAWSPFQYGMFEGVFLDNPKFPELNIVMDELAEKYNVTKSAIAVAWILRHPAKIQTIVGTTNKERLQGICKASDIYLTREEWYRLYMAAGKRLP